MRLIHCATLTLKLFNNEEQLPEYAILSHRWLDGQEVLFKDMVKFRNLDLCGWRKIRLCCDQALRDGIEFCWVDTCCIDKTSSAELSEAINSMYRYYANSKVCYAYLVDVDHSAGIALEAQFGQSSWFTRCWTLQELIAPSVVEFYDKAWKRLGTRSDLSEEVAEASGIHLSVFTSHFEPEEWSIAQRMSWASKRQATRVEDVAYSLLGLFDVNIPLLYGEREKAFLRLQEEIIRRTNDHTIFGWSTFQNEPDPSAVISYTGLLVPSPYAFKDDSDLVARKSEDTCAYAINNLGLEVSLPVVHWAPNILLVGLNCTRNSQDRVYIFVMDSPDIAPLSVRSACKGMVSIDLKWHLPSSTHRRLTLLTRLELSMRAELSTLKADQHPYLRWDRTIMDTFPQIIRSYRLRNVASYWLIHRRPLYGFHCVLRIGDYKYPGESDQGSVARYNGFMKVGLDLELNPICIVSDRTYDNKAVPHWFSDVNLLYTNNEDIITKTFWECTGLEETGWQRPDTSSSTPISKSKHGIWALKGVHGSSCRFVLAGDRVGEQFMLEMVRRRDAFLRAYYQIELSGFREDLRIRKAPAVGGKKVIIKMLRCAYLNSEGGDPCSDCIKGLEEKYSVLPRCPHRPIDP